MASNVSGGTRGLSARDWTLLKKLKGSSRYLAEQSKDVINPSPIQQPKDGGRHIFTEFGTSKTRRPSSYWTDYVHATKGDYVLEKQDPLTKQRTLTTHRICNCNISDAIKHGGICIKCTYDPIVNIPVPPNIPGQFTDIVNYRLYKNNAQGQPIFGNVSTYGTLDTNGLINTIITRNTTCLPAGRTLIPPFDPTDNSYNFIVIDIDGFFLPPQTGFYRFDIDSDAGIAISINGKTIINTIATHGYWTSFEGNTDTTDLLEAGKKYVIRFLWTNDIGFYKCCMGVNYSQGESGPFTPTQNTFRSLFVPR